MKTNSTDSVRRRSPRPRLERFYRRLGWLLRVVSGGLFLLLFVLSITWMIHGGIDKVSYIDAIVLAFVVSMLVLVALPGRQAHFFRKKATALAIGTLFASLLLEGYVRVFDPFPIMLRGGRIDLPVNSKRQFYTNRMPGLDENVAVRFNSLGFRGPEPPIDWDNQFTILCVGGSTTQCLYLSDETTWPARLAAKLTEDFDNVWINNAGIDGHSTYGHLELLDQYIAALHPKMLLLYVGLNDVDRKDLGEYDLSTLRSQSRTNDSLGRSLQRCLLRNSDAFALLDSFRMQWSAKRKGLTHGEPIVHRKSTQEIDAIALSPSESQKWLAERDASCLSNYEARLRMFVERCKRLQIDCVLMTQAVLYGVGSDDVTRVDLESIRVGEVDGWTHWKLLQQYNAITVQIGEQLDLPIVDIASKMPKSSRYFYDLTHFNIEGAEKVASIIYEELVPILNSREQASAR